MDGCEQPPEECQRHRGSTLFCQLCGKVRNPGDLSTVRLDKFRGRDSLSPQMEKFFATGDPNVFASRR